jgi:hypothetical protein
MANPMLDTASQRPATGMDKGARQLILNALQLNSSERCSNDAVMKAFIHAL